MTRETKIGLLVGLGFIIVFAVLLSHNGTGPSPTQTLPPIASANAPDSAQAAGAKLAPPPVIEPVAGSAAPVPEDVDGTSEWRDPITGLVSGTGDDLPAPTDLNRPGVITDGPPVGEGGFRETLALAGGSRDDDPGNTRVAPPIVTPSEPVPTLRPVGPAMTELSGGSDVEAPRAAGGDVTAGGSHATPTPTKPYLVHKGDTLVKITKEIYGKSTPDVISLVVDANKGTIKGRDSLREGQTIVIPPLPADMFEPTPAVAGGVDMRRVDHMLNSPEQRRAPGTAGPKPAPDDTKPLKPGVPGPSAGSSGGYIPSQGQKSGDRPEAKPEKPAGADKSDKKTDAVKPVTAPKADASKPATPPKGAKKEPSTTPKPRPNMRLYQIQPKDTFTSIAQRELGAGNRWAEIKQMNKDIDPSKMKPGTKIKIPSRGPVSADASTKQVSA